VDFPVAVAGEITARGRGRSFGLGLSGTSESRRSAGDLGGATGRTVTLRCVECVVLEGDNVESHTTALRLLRRVARANRN
jgi:hypothetical protein